METNKDDRSVHLIEAISKQLGLPMGLLESAKIFILFRRELEKESDRGMALLAAAFLDNQVEEMIKSKLLGNDKHLKQMFQFNGALGTFSSKINLGYSIGLISKSCHNDLDIIRRIRNEFAHSMEIISFGDQKIIDLSNNFQLNAKNKSDTRTIFIHVVAGISGFIEITSKNKNKFNELEDPDLEERKENFQEFMGKVMKNRQE
jgi:DNA-binding MltR family transcriptional regulator